MTILSADSIEYFRFLVRDKGIPVEVRASAFQSLEQIYHAQPFYAKAVENRTDVWHHFVEFDESQLEFTYTEYSRDYEIILSLIPVWSWKGEIEPPKPHMPSFANRQDTLREMSLIWERYQITLLLLEAFNSDEAEMQRAAWYVWKGESRIESMKIRNRGQTNLLPMIISAYKTSPVVREYAVCELARWIAHSKDEAYRYEVLKRLIENALVPKLSEIAEQENV